MCPTHAMRLRQEVDLMARFAETYRGKFSDLIEQLNRPHGHDTDVQGIRLCVEAMNMLLSAQSHLAEAIGTLESTSS